MRRVLAGVAYGGIALNVALMALVGACRFPSAVPAMGGDGVFPRLTWPYTSGLWATGLLWAAMISGFAGLAAGLATSLRPRGLVAGGLLAVGVLVAAPPMGTTDTMDYVVYGRMTVLGHDPHVMTPREFRATGDRVGALAPVPWQDTPSVYGPLATGTEWAAAVLSRGSATAAVLWLKVWNALAFLAAALALDRLAGPDRARRSRVHLLWTLNPLLLWALIGGAHVDGLAAGLAVLGLAVAGPSARVSLARSAAAGLLLGAAGAVKAPYLLLGVVAAWSLRRSPRALVAATRLDWVQLGRALVATIGCLPGLAVRFGCTWLRTGPLPYVVPGALLVLLVCLLCGPIVLRRRSAPEYRAAASSPSA